MVIPWRGIPLKDVIDRAQPRASAKYVEFTTLMDPRQMPGQRMPMLDWPYVEGLRLDEARHPLTLLATGVYGRDLPNQNGAPLRLVVPWKYGFKGIKSIVRIRFTETDAAHIVDAAAPNEYGFYANVNPRWIIPAGARPPSGALASSAAVRRCRSTATRTRWRRCTRGWTSAGTTECAHSAVSRGSRAGSAVCWWSLAALPALWYAWAHLLRFSRGTRFLGSDPIKAAEHAYGLWTLRFLLVTLAVTPLRSLTGWNWLAKHRRTLGLYAFAYGVLHLLVWVFLDLQWLLDDLVGWRELSADHLQAAVHHDRDGGAAADAASRRDVHQEDDCAAREEVAAVAPARLCGGGAGHHSLLDGGEARLARAGGIRRGARLVTGLASGRATPRERARIDCGGEPPATQRSLRRLGRRGPRS
jgi:hypothetical protein